MTEPRDLAQRLREALTDEVLVSPNELECLVPDQCDGCIKERAAIAERRRSRLVPVILAVLPPTPQPETLNVEAMRSNLHATFNGGHHEEPARSAFHHGMDTACNVLEAQQNGESTSGILPAAAPQPETCAWTTDEDGIWYTACGEAWCFDTGGPADNKVRFCFYCGAACKPTDQTGETT